MGPCCPGRLPSQGVSGLGLRFSRAILGDRDLLSPQQPVCVRCGRVLGTGQAALASGGGGRGNESPWRSRQGHARRPRAAARSREPGSLGMPSAGPGPGRPSCPGGGRASLSHQRGTLRQEPRATEEVWRREARLSAHRVRSRWLHWVKKNSSPGNREDRRGCGQGPAGQPPQRGRWTACFRAAGRGWGGPWGCLGSFLVQIQPPLHPRQPQTPHFSLFKGPWHSPVCTGVAMGVGGGQPAGSARAKVLPLGLHPSVSLTPALPCKPRGLLRGPAQRPGSPRGRPPGRSPRGPDLGSHCPSPRNVLPFPAFTESRVLPGADRVREAGPC